MRRAAEHERCERERTLGNGMRFAQVLITLCAADCLGTTILLAGQIRNQVCEQLTQLRHNSST